MFECGVAGRLLQTNLGYGCNGCTAHFFWPGKGSWDVSIYPRLSNEKPSAIFRLRSTLSTPASGMSTPPRRHYRHPQTRN
ncbi:hypothetical protein EDD15DRAFT_2179679 [Pisolithus albus]|nr:hypothetical protein EDD15DRAFT_2179640 [Pisolithus albus]KAI5983035.1 hypothetical protein EDD15DRAFT_2179679 [Pisolithus albus]